MKRYLLFTLFLCFLCLINWIAKAQTSSTSNDPKDVETVDGIVAALYDVTSGEKGQIRDWERFRFLFLPKAMLIPSGRSNEDGAI